MVEGLWIWLICAGVPLLFGLWAQMRVKSTFKRYSHMPTSGGLTGAQAATAVVQYSGLEGDEVDGAQAVLRAAALTYVAGFVASLGQLIYFFLISRR